MWTVRLDPYGRPAAGTVRLSCSCPACPDQHLPGASPGRRAAVGHVNTHLARIRADGGPRDQARCSCRAADCAWHTPDPAAQPRGGARPAAGAARCGTGNVTGQDLTGWLQGDVERVLGRLVSDGWLHLPGTVAEVTASRPEDPTAFTVPALLPDHPRPFAFGKVTRARVSGWAQKVVGDRKIRTKKPGAATRLLALYTAAHTRPDGGLGHREDGGLRLDDVAAFTTLPPNRVAEHADLLTAADWLTEADTTRGRVRGRLTERVLPLGGLL